MGIFLYVFWKKKKKKRKNNSIPNLICLILFFKRNT